MELELQFEKIKNQVKIRGGQVWISHNSVCDGRRGTVVILKIGTEEYMGDAYCSLDDMFSKKKGRSIAIGRAWKKFLTECDSKDCSFKLNLTPSHIGIKLEEK